MPLARSLSVVRVCCPILVIALPSLTCAQTPIAPRAHIAAPDIYKVLAEGHQQRVIEATLKPGQESPAVSHPQGTVVYYVTDCSLKGTSNSVEWHSYPGAGSARIIAATSSQTRMNIGKSDCKIVFIERE